MHACSLYMGMSENLLRRYISSAAVVYGGLALWAYGDFVSDSHLTVGVLGFPEALYHVWLYMGSGFLKSSLHISVALFTHWAIFPGLISLFLSRGDSGSDNWLGKTLRSGNVYHSLSPCIINFIPVFCCSKTEKTQWEPRSEEGLYPQPPPSFKFIYQHPYLIGEKTRPQVCLVLFFSFL